MPRSYLDHAATTPMVPEAVEAMARELGRIGNPSSPHGSGRAARKVVEESRESIAERLGASPGEVLFTSGGTEADNLAVKGAYWAQAARGRRGVVTSGIEHHAVLDAVGWLAQATNAEASYLPVDRHGHVEAASIAAAVDQRTAVVSVIWANNETGAVQPVRAVAEAAARSGALSHSDAVQAVGHLPVDFSGSGLDLVSIAAHKLGGPRGVGALLVGREVELTPLAHGGGQEREVRSGSVDVAAVAGFAAAVRVATDRLAEEGARLHALRDDLIARVQVAVPDAVLHGTLTRSATLPGIAYLGFPGCPAESLLLLLDAAGVDCSAGSACTAGVFRPSHVLVAMGCTDVEASSALRFSLGHTSTAEEISTLVAALPEAVRRARAAAAFA